ncbi:unnamed protein product, partial [Ascophyllum nodosum]
MSNKLNLMVELRRKHAARAIQRWASLIRRRTLVRSVLQPFMMNSAVILKYLRAAEHFRRLLLERRASTAVVRWYRGDRDRKRFLKQKAAAVIIQAALRRRLAVVHLKVVKEFSPVSLENLQASLEACKAELAAAQKAK